MQPKVPRVRLIMLLGMIALGMVSQSSGPLVAASSSAFSSDDVASARRAFERGDAAEARRVLERVVAATPADADAWFFLAQVALELRERTRGLEALAQVARLQPALAGHEAVTSLRARLEALPPPPPPRSVEQRLAVASAKRALDEARQANDQNTQRRLATEARNRLARLLIDPRVDDLEAWHLLGASAVIRAHRADAAVAFEAIDRLEPQWWNHAELEVLMVGLDRLDASRRKEEIAARRQELLSLWARTDRRDATAWVALGDLYAAGRGLLGGIPEAEQFWQQAASMGPQPAAGTRTPGELWSPIRIGDRSISFTWIPPGTFMMGSPGEERERRADEGPRRPVLISRGFWMMQTEVTQQLWQSMMGSNPSTFRGGGKGGPQHPVDSISWFDAVEFANRLTEKVAELVPTLGLKPAYELRNIRREGNRIIAADVRRIPGNRGFRLPTEAEWEYACRAGTTTRYHGGDSISSAHAVFGLSWEHGSTAPGGSRGSAGRNAWGLDDMHGNVWEWCWDRYDASWYGANSVARDSFGRRVDPVGPSGGESRVLRGGSWLINPLFLRSAYRGRVTPAFRDFDYGVRLALDSE